MYVVYTVSMILLTHILIALLSVVYTAYLSVKPQANKFIIAYGLIGATFASGTYLVISHPGHLAQACLSGILYISVVLAVLLTARHKLAKLTIAE